MKQIFILGQNPALSTAEIITLTKRLELFVGLIEVSPEFLLLELRQALDLRQLGGTVKTGVVIDEVAEANLELFVGRALQELQKLALPKVWFGFSFYGQNSNYFQAKDAGMMIKRRLELVDIASRFVVAKGKQLSSVIVQKEHLLDKGRDFLVAAIGSKVYFGYTTAVQEFEAYGERDFGRPSRDAVSGMLPPKLAKMMLNLAGIKSNTKTLDPFCGSGTVLQEALLLGVKKVYGTDSSAKAVADAQRNLNWLKTKQPNLSQQEVKIFQADVKFIDKYFNESKVDVIVTEPYLGPALKIKDLISFRKEPLKLQMLVKEIEQLYSLALTVFVEILNPKGRVVMIWPNWKIGNKIYRLELVKKLNQLGFKIINPLAEVKFGFKEKTERQTIIYQRNEQIILREVVILERD